MFKVAPTATGMTRLARHEGGTANDLGTAGAGEMEAGRGTVGDIAIWSGMGAIISGLSGVTANESIEVARRNRFESAPIRPITDRISLFVASGEPPPAR